MSPEKVTARQVARLKEALDRTIAAQDAAAKEAGTFAFAPAEGGEANRAVTSRTVFGPYRFFDGIREGFGR